MSIKRAGETGAAIFLMALCLLCAVSPLAAQAPIVARAASVSGPALVYAAGAAGAVVVSTGFFLNPGDRVDTRGGGRVTVELNDGSMVVIEPESVIVLKDFRQAESLREFFEIVLGKVRVKINHIGGRPNPYRMNSPTASIAVRGTEFSIDVGPGGDTQVTVYEGAVQVTSLSDPDQSVLVEAGRGVLVQSGRDLRLLAAAGNASGNAAAKADDRASAGSSKSDDTRVIANNGNSGGHESDDHEDHRSPSTPQSVTPSSESSKNSASPAAVAGREKAEHEDHNWQSSGSNTPSNSHSVVSSGNQGSGESEDEREDDDNGSSQSSGSKSGGSSSSSTKAPRPANTPRATSGLYDSFMAGMLDTAQLPFSYRFTAFAESHLDSLENPAYATQFTTAEARLFLLPTYGVGSDAAAGALPAGYTVAPRISMFGRLGNSNFYTGGSASGFHAGDQSGSSAATFYSGSLVLARRVGRSSLGFEWESLRGNGSVFERHHLCRRPAFGRVDPGGYHHLPVPDHGRCFARF